MIGPARLLCIPRVVSHPLLQPHLRRCWPDVTLINVEGRVSVQLVGREHHTHTSRGRNIINNSPVEPFVN